MIKVAISTAAAVALMSGFFNAFEDGADLTTVAENLVAVAGAESGKAFDLGDKRTVDGAFNSGALSYDGSRF